MPSYANVQSYTQSIVLCSSSRQNCRPLDLGKIVCLRSSIPVLLAHFRLLSLLLIETLVPSGKIKSHIGSSSCVPESGPLCFVLSLPKRCWNLGLSFSQLRERNRKLKKVIPVPRIGILCSDSLRMMKKWPCIRAR
jgi:hypothetical protein